MRGPRLFRFHEFGRFGGVSRIQELCHHERELFELNRLCDVRVEAGPDALFVDVAKDVRRKSNDRVATVPVFLFPSPNFLAGLVTIFIWHMQVALHKQ